MLASVHRGAAATLVVACACLASVAHADGPKPEDSFEAQRLFNDGLADMKAGRYEEACPKLDRSQLLEPAMGTEFRLAECLEKIGKLVRAGALYQDVADQAKAQGKTDRMKQAQEAGDAIRPHVPALVVHVSPEASAVPGLEIYRDDVKLDPKALAERVPVDPGKHKVTARAPGYVTFEQESKLAEFEIGHVTVPVLSKITGPVGPGAPMLKKENATIPLALAGAFGGLGLVGLGVGIGFGVRANDQWNEAGNECLPGSPPICNAKGVDAHDAAALSATLSTAGFVVGGVAIAAAIPALVIGARRTAWNEAVARQKPSAMVVPIAAPGVAGIGAVGKF